MKRKFRRTLATVMAAALTVSLMGTADAEAAKKIKLSKKSITVTKGKSKTVTVKNVKAKKVKKLTVKSSKKKIATVKKSGKTKVKVTGKKAGSAKVTVSVTLKGKKKATKLTLKVKVKNAAKKTTPAAPTAAPATTAPTAAPGGQQPGGQQPGGQATNPPGGDATEKPGDPTEKPGDPTKVPGTPTPNPWDGFEKPDPAANVTLTYNDQLKSEENPNGGKLETYGKFNFKDGEGYPEGGIDVMKYDRVIIRIAATEEVVGTSEWVGKVALTSSDGEATDYTGLGATDDGFHTEGGTDTKVKYLNDLGLKDGMYEAVYKIPDSIDKDTWSPEEISMYCDAINLQLADSEEYAKLTLKEIAFESDKQPTPTDDPKATDDPDATKAPGATDEPDATKDPNATQDPNATENPNATQNPNATENPNATQNPNATENPNATQNPNATPSAEPTKEPVTDKDIVITVKQGDLETNTVKVNETASVDVALQNGVEAEIENVDLAVVETNAVIEGKKLTGKAAGPATIKATVTIKDQTDVVEVTKKITIAAEDALVVRADIESVPTEIAIGESASLEVKVDTGVIESVKWEITGDAATIETNAVEEAVAKLNAVKEGVVKVKVTVTAKCGEKVSEPATKEVTIKVTPITYAIGQDFNNTGDSESYMLYDIPEAIRIKKTDIVKVVLSSEDSAVKAKVALSNSTKPMPANIYQDAQLVSEAAGMGEVVLTMNPTFFQSNFVDLDKVVVLVPAGKKVRVEKVLVTPTDKVAISVTGLTTIEKDATSELTAEIADEDFDDLEWVSSNSAVASVEQDGTNPKKATVTGAAEGTAVITVKAIKDGKEVEKEEVSFTVTKKLSGSEYTFDLSTMPGYDANTKTVTLTSAPVIVKLPKDDEGHDLVVGAGQKVKITFDYEIPSGGNGIRAYLIANAIDESTTKEGSQDVKGTDITWTSNGNSTHLMIKGQNWVNPNLIIKSMKLEFVQ